MKRSLLLTLALMMLAAMLTACGNGSASSQASTSSTEDATPAETLTEEAAAPSEAKAETAASDGLAIPLDSLGTEPLFVDREQDGMPMQLIALLDGNQMRLAVFCNMRKQGILTESDLAVAEKYLHEKYQPIFTAA